MATPTSLPASFTSGAVLTAAQMNDLRGAFRILQVVQDTSATSTSTTSTSYADTGLSVSITPSATSNKILLVASINGAAKTAGNDQTAIKLQLVRDTTAIQLIEGQGGYTNTNLLNVFGGTVGFYLDSPNTTSATTYKIQFGSTNSGFTASINYASAVSTLTAFEVSA